MTDPLSLVDSLYASRMLWHCTAAATLAGRAADGALSAGGDAEVARQDFVRTGAPRGRKRRVVLRHSSATRCCPSSALRWLSVLLTGRLMRRSTLAGHGTLPLTQFCRGIIRSSRDALIASVVVVAGNLLADICWHCRSRLRVPRDTDLC